MVGEARVPFFINAFEKSVRVVIFTALELDHPLGILPDKEAYHIAWTAVVSAIQVTVLLGELIISALKLIQPFFIESANRLAEVTEGGRFFQI